MSSTYAANQAHPVRVAPKDPDATAIPYSVNWSDWLGGATISSVAWVVDSGITNAGESNTTTVATIKLSGGTAGTDYTVTCRVTASDSRVDDRSFILRVTER